jgi:hypothetical protein
MSKKRNNGEITAFFSPKRARKIVKDDQDDCAEKSPTRSVAEVSDALGSTPPNDAKQSEPKVEELSSTPSVVDEVTSLSTTVVAGNSSPDWLDASLYGGWREFLEGQFSKSYFQNLKRYVLSEMESHIVYPPRNQVFSAFSTCDLDHIKVVIIGQDPYHGPHQVRIPTRLVTKLKNNMIDQAHGLAFSVLEGNSPPPSLLNIFKEAKVKSNPHLISSESY